MHRASPLSRFALALTAAAAMSACSRANEAPAPAAAAQQQAQTPAATSTVATQKIRPVESKKVCMINNRLFDVDQIPVTVASKTYFGCCPMCKDRLEQDERSRMSTDPVSGKHVDKAVAVIGARPSGEVVYFESRANLEAYAAR